MSHKSTTGLISERQFALAWNADFRQVGLSSVLSFHSISKNPIISQI